MVELDGLSRGSKDRHFDSAEHADMLRSSAQQAVAFLEHSFDARNSHLRALTAEGTTLDTIAFRSEQLKDSVSWCNMSVTGLREVHEAFQTETW